MIINIFDWVYPKNNKGTAYIVNHIYDNKADIQSIDNNRLYLEFSKLELITDKNLILELNNTMYNQ